VVQVYWGTAATFSSNWTSGGAGAARDDGGDRMSARNGGPLPTPYIGPKPFETGMRIFGRDQDLHHLLHTC
jgi:hypothetical protein